MGPKRFSAYALKWGSTTQTLGTGKVREWLEGLSIPAETHDNSPRELPEASVDVSVEAISESLFAKGVASGAINALTSQMGELVRIARWYTLDGAHYPSEHETVAYLVIPLLRTLGWTPQKMAVEWNRVDVALFSALPRCDDELAVVVEAKRMRNSCLTALSQAESYAESRPGCTRLIVTDGVRYGVYVKGPRGFELHSYLNLTRPRTS